MKYLAAAIVVVFSLSLAAPAAQAKLTEVGPGLSIVGKLEGQGATGSDRIIAVLPQEQRLIALHLRDNLYDPSLRLYDLRTRVPKFIKSRALEAPYDSIKLQYPGPYTSFTADEGRHHFMRVQSNGTDPLDISSTVTVFDTRTLQGVAIWDLTTQLPGFLAYGVTYSKADDRLYVVGEVANHALGEDTLGSTYGVKPTALTEIVALNAADGTLVWKKFVTQCRQPLFTSQTGSVIARSEYEPAIYFACMRSFLYPGLSSIIRLRITPHGGRKVADDADAASFKTEAFPFSSAFTTSQGIFGIVRFDPATDRMIVQSIAYASPGAWVFDGRTSSWVGQMGTPPLPASLGFSEFTGHAYMAATLGTSFQYLDVADARATPASQGRLYTIPGAPTLSTIVTEPHGRRLFLPVGDLGAYGVGKKGESGYVVLEDRVPEALPPDEVTYDELTTDVDEGPATAATYSGNISGFGSLINLVGGYKGILSIGAGGGGQDIVKVRGIAPGDRGVYGAQVTSVDVRNSGASASARALAPDTVTDSDRGNAQELSRTRPSSMGGRVDDALAPYADTQGAGRTASQEVGCSDVKESTCSDAAAAAGQHVSGDETVQPVQKSNVAPLLDWRWFASTCLDAGGDAKPAPQPDAGLGGTAHVTCDLGTSQASANSSFGAISADLQGDLTVRVASSSFDSRSARQAQKGIVNEATSIARGVKITLPGVGTLSISKVVAVAETIADGHPGHAQTSYSRLFEGVQITDATGKVLYACDDAAGSDNHCDPRELVDTANSVFESQLRIRAPKPRQERTPRGAFAGIQKNEADYYNDLATNNLDSYAVPALDILVINDSVEKSRVHVQLAAIQATSVYGITLLNSAVPEVPVPPILPGSLTGGGGLLDGKSQAGPVVQPGPTGLGDAIVKAVKEALFLIRSPKEALFVSLVWLLFAAAGASAARRKKLMSLLNAA